MGRVCAAPGCPEYTKSDRYCAEHQPKQATRPRGEAQRKYDRTRPSRHKLGYGSKWDKARAKFLKQHPRCARCPKPSTDVDHIKPWKVNGRKNWSLFWSVANWQALCHSCHSKKTRAESSAPKQSDTTEN